MKQDCIIPNPLQYLVYNYVYMRLAFVLRLETPKCLSISFSQQNIWAIAAETMLSLKYCSHASRVRFPVRGDRSRNFAAQTLENIPQIECF